MERILQKQNLMLAEHGRTLEKIEDHAKADKLLQGVQIITAYKNLKDSDRIVEEIDSLEDVSKEGLLATKGDGLNANVIKLIDTIRENSKGFSGPTGSAPVPPPNVADDSFFKGATGALQDTKKQFTTLEGFFDLEGSKGWLGEIIKKKVARDKYVKDQLALDPTADRKQLGQQFNQINETIGEQQKTQGKIEDLRKQGYSDEQIGQMGVFERQETLANRREALDNRRGNVPTTMPTLASIAASDPLSARSTEAQTENTEIIGDQNELMVEIRDNTELTFSAVHKGLIDKRGGGLLQTSIEILEQLKEGSSKSEGSGSSSLVGDLAKGAGALGLGKALLGGAKGALAGGGSTLLAGGAMIAAPWAADAALGALGVGGNKIDEGQDEANWGRMSFFEKAESGLARGIEKVGGLFGGNISNEARSNRIKRESEYLASKGRSPTTPYPSPSTNSGAVTTESKEEYIVNGRPIIKARPMTKEETAATLKESLAADQDQLTNIETGLEPGMKNWTPARESRTVQELQRRIQSTKVELERMSPPAPKEEYEASQAAMAAKTAEMEGMLEGRQSGGPVEPGKPYLVGEAGPELIVPNQRSKVIPTGQSETIDLGDGMRKTINPDGSYTISNAQGVWKYNADGSTQYTTPTFGGYSQTTMSDGSMRENYASGALQASRTTNAAGNLVGTSSSYQVADQIYSQSSENAGMASQPAQAPVIINAPSNASVNQTSNYAVPSPPRNTDSSVKEYNRARFA